VQLECGHLFHYQCVRKSLEHRWSTNHISFSFMHCPVCKKEVAHLALDELLQPIRELRGQVADLALARLLDNMTDEDRDTLADTSNAFYQLPRDYALHTLRWVICCGRSVPFRHCFLSSLDVVDGLTLMACSRVGVFACVLQILYVLSMCQAVLWWSACL
jgi:hypothetical protein